jgi:hypothetical protein
MAMFWALPAYLQAGEEFNPGSSSWNVVAVVSPGRHWDLQGRNDMVLQERIGSDHSDSTESGIILGMEFSLPIGSGSDLPLPTVFAVSFSSAASAVKV